MQLVQNGLLHSKIDIKIFEELNISTLGFPVRLEPLGIKLNEMRHYLDKVETELNYVKIFRILLKVKLKVQVFSIN